MKIYIEVEVPDDFEMGNIKAVELREAIDLGYWQQVSDKPIWFACDTEGAEFDVTFVTTQEEAAMAVESALADDPDLKFEDLVTPLFQAPQQREPLSDAEIESLGGKWVRDGYDVQALVRAIESAHNIGVKS